MVQTIALVPSPLLDPLPELGEAGRPSAILRPGDFTDWDGVFAAHPDAEDYLLEPGDYQAWGACVIDRANPPGRRRLIRFIDTAMRPWARTDNEAVTQGFQFTSGAAHWAVHGLTLRGPGTPTCIVRPGAEHIVFDSLLAEDVDKVHTIRLSGNHCTVQNCVIRRAWAPDHDASGVSVAVAGVHNAGNRILDNEIYDCGDGVAVSWDDSDSHHYSLECRDLVVEGNDIYLTELRHVEQPGPDGPRVYATAENGMDIKTGPRTTEEPLRFTRNRIWGYRTPVPGSAHASDGAAVTIHRAAQRLLFDGNVIFDCPIAFHEVVRDPADPRQGAREVTVRSTVISFMHSYNPGDLGAVLRTKLPFHLEGNRFSRSRTLSALKKMQPTHDVFVDNVLHQDTPPGEAAADWDAGTGNQVAAPGDMRDVLVQRCRWTGPGLVRLDGAVLSGDMF
jgi:hypothetical protein